MWKIYKIAILLIFATHKSNGEMGAQDPNNSRLMSPVNTTAPVDDGKGELNGTWILLYTFLILSMQVGYALLESGTVSHKNSVNIMFKNAIDLIFTGTIYWLVGFSLAYGTGPNANGFCGAGSWALANIPLAKLGSTMIHFIFQLSFVTATATIVSGAVAERILMRSYIVFISVNSFAYSIGTHWLWDTKGWLYNLGAIDIAGAAVVHAYGGASAFVAAWMLGPRSGRYDNSMQASPVGNGFNVFVGTFLLWWGWLAFNSASVYGVHNGLWTSSAKAAVVTVIASFAGGTCGILVSLFKSKGNIFYLTDLAYGVRAGLVSVAGVCSLIEPWEAYIIGAAAALAVIYAIKFFDYLQIDDPVGAISVHGIGGVIGVVVTGIFMREDPVSGLNRGILGIFQGGSFKTIGVQLLVVVVFSCWAVMWSLATILILKKSPLGYRLSNYDELIGSDKTEHGIGEDRPAWTESMSTGQMFQLEHRFGDTPVQLLGIVDRTTVSSGQENKLPLFAYDASELLVDDTDLDEQLRECKTITIHGTRIICLSGLNKNKHLEMKEKEVSIFKPESIPDVTEGDSREKLVLQNSEPLSTTTPPYNISKTENAL